MTEGIRYQAIRANPALLEQRREGEHVWIVAATWVMPGETLLAAHRGRETTMMWDQENLGMFATGCFICEQPFSERLYHRKCPGEPR